MVDLASIRNASFSLTPTGYNPEEVDRFLNDLADNGLESANPAAIRNASFSLTPTGYNPEEVDHYLVDIADQLEDDSQPAAQATYEPEAAEAQEQVEPSEETTEDEHETVEEPVAEVEDEPSMTTRSRPPRSAEPEHEFAPHVAIEEEPSPSPPTRTPRPRPRGARPAEAEAPDAEAEPEAEDDSAVSGTSPRRPLRGARDRPRCVEAPVGARRRRQRPRDRRWPNAPTTSWTRWATSAEEAIRALQSFVTNELAAVRTASTPGGGGHPPRAGTPDRGGRERSRRAPGANPRPRRPHPAEREGRGRAHPHARRSGGESKREAFERELAERETQAERRANQILDEAEQRRHEADELYASASQAQAHMLASFEQARAALIDAAERGPSSPTVTRFEVATSDSTRDSEQHPSSGEQTDATDAAA